MFGEYAIIYSRRNEDQTSSMKELVARLWDLLLSCRMAPSIFASCGVVTPFFVPHPVRRIRMYIRQNNEALPTSVMMYLHPLNDPTDVSILKGLGRLSSLDTSAVRPLARNNALGHFHN